MVKISNDKFLFSYPLPQQILVNKKFVTYDKQPVLFRAKRNMPLECFTTIENKTGFMECIDHLCMYCEHSFDFNKFSFLSGYCLIRKKGFTSFCDHFQLGFGFGSDLKKDRQEERKKSAIKLAEIGLFKNCMYCQNWNTDNVINVSDEIDPDADDCIKDGNKFTNFMCKNKFCEFGKKPHNLAAPCDSFKLTAKKFERETYAKQCPAVHLYLTKLEKQNTHLKNKGQKCPNKGKLT